MRNLQTVVCGLLLTGVLLYSGSVRADHMTSIAKFDLIAAGPIITIPARTLPQGTTVASLSLLYLNNNELSDATLKAAAGRHEEHVHSTARVRATALSLSHGVTDDFSLGLRLPYVKRRDIREGEHHHDLAGDQVAGLGASGGLGDLTAIGQYRLYRSEDKRHAAALLLGTRMPTGTTSERTNEDNKFDVDEQPGSGAWSGLFGASWSSAFGRLEIDSNILYTLSTRGARDVDLGDILNYNLSFAWGLALGTVHHHKEGATHIHRRDGVLRGVNVVLEVNGVWRQQITVGGKEEANTGGNITYLSPGIRAAVAGGWSAYANLGVPVIEGLNGLQSEPRYRVVAGVNKSFSWY